MKRDSVSVYVHMRRDIPSPPPPPYAVVPILDDPPILPQAAYGLECNFYVENLKIALFCNTLIYKLQVFCSLKLKLYYWDFTMCGTCSRKKRTNLFKRQTIQRLTKFLIITFFMHFLKQNLGLDFLDEILPFTESFIFQLSTSIMTALSNPFMSGWYRQFHMRTTRWHFKGACNHKMF